MEEDWVVLCQAQKQPKKRRVDENSFEFEGSLRKDWSGERCGESRLSG